MEVPGLNEILGISLKVLVDGFVRLSMGSIQSLNSHQWLVAFCKRINEQIESPAQQIPNTTNHHIAQK